VSLTELNRMSVAELAPAIASKKVSPVEVVDAALARLEETEPQLNAFAHVDAPGARKAAKIAEQSLARGEAKGALFGIPVSVKDLIDVGGLPARYGSLTLKDHIAAEDAPSVARLRAAGAIIIGKTATSEFGSRGVTTNLLQGTTKNPWDLSRTPGGSSGGAVASVAAGVVPIGLGTDGGGSVRAPSSLTGLVGIKANFGRVPVWPASATQTVAHVGPIARNVADAALLLKTIAGADYRDPFSLLAATDFDRRERMSELRVAFAPSLGYGSVDKPVADVVAAAVRRLQTLFPKLDQVESVCPDPAEILATEFIGGCSARLGDLVDQTPQAIDPVLLGAIHSFRQMKADQYTRILRKRIVHREVLRAFFERYDVLLTPTVPCTAWSHEVGTPPGHEAAISWSYFTYPFNLTGQPAASLPCGLAGHLPVGLQIVVPLCREDRLLAVLAEIEAVIGSLQTPLDRLTSKS
jgi:aspartyl-tRNA(Asn)/glutamyl-tRNA(Gln) amidotransferase subunit A